MKKNITVLIAVSLVTGSCKTTERDLGNNFILYKGDVSYPYSIGLSLGNGGIQGLLDGDITNYGYDATYITIKTRKNQYFYIDKLRILKDPAALQSRGNGPLSRSQFVEMTKIKGLPCLSFSL